MWRFMVVRMFCLGSGAAVLADFVPTAPGPGDIFAMGSNCTIKWDADTTGAWTNTSIDSFAQPDLMSGSDDNMTFVTRVVSGLDGTSEVCTTYNWTCPDVDPNSAIYFYEFSNGGDRSSMKWTTRFTISSSSGDITPPQNPNQPNGDPIPWGSGHLISSSATEQTAETAPVESSAYASTVTTPEPPSTRAGKKTTRTSGTWLSTVTSPCSSKAGKEPKHTTETRHAASATQAMPTLYLPPQAPPDYRVSKGSVMMNSGSMQRKISSCMYTVLLASMFIL